MKIEDFFTVYLEGSYDIYFDVINCTEYISTIRTYDKAQSTRLKSYKVLKNKKFNHKKKNKIGTFLIYLLNNSDKLIKLLKENEQNIIDYKPFYIDIYKSIRGTSKCLSKPFNSSNVKPHIYTGTSMYTIRKVYSGIPPILRQLDDEPNPSDIRTKLSNILKDYRVKKIISKIKFLLDEVDKIYKKTSKKSGYVSYTSNIIPIPQAHILFMKTKTHLVPYLYKYQISSLEDLFYVSIHSLSLAKYKIYKCEICDKYFISNKVKKTCSSVCQKKSQELKEEKNRNRARGKNSSEVNYLLKKIRGVLSRIVKNKNEQNRRDLMLENFEKRYKNKLSTLNKRYKIKTNNGYNNELTKWLEHEYKKVQKEFPSKRYGNKNRLLD